VVCVSIAAGVALAAIFGFVECRRRHPRLEVRLFGNAEFAAGAATITVLFLATFGFFFLLMQYCQLVLGYTSLQTAMALTPLVVGLTLLSGFSFWYLPKLGLRLVFFLGLTTMAVGFLCLQRLGLHSSYVELAWPLLVLSTGIGMCTARRPLRSWVRRPTRSRGSRRRSTTPPANSELHSDSRSPDRCWPLSTPAACHRNSHRCPKRCAALRRTRWPSRSRCRIASAHRAPSSSTSAARHSSTQCSRRCTCWPVSQLLQPW